MGSLCPYYQISTFLSSSLFPNFFPYCPSYHTWCHRMALVLIWAVDSPAYEISLTIGTEIRRLSLFPVFFSISQQTYGVITPFRPIQICHLVGKESVTSLGPITGTYQQGQLSGSALSPSQQTFRILGKGHLVL